LSLGERTLDELLTELAAPAPSPCGGATAALTAAMACSLVAMVARGASGWNDADATAAKAIELRGELLALAREDTEAVSGLIGLRRLPAAERSEAIERAIRAPAAIHQAAAEAAELAALAGEHGKRVMRADASAARLLATAAAGVAAEIAATNQSG
jgi:formiminotetrahydrofolate cyclodeaminase